MSKISLEKYFVGLSKDSLIYGLGNAILKILALITAPIFTRIFIPAEYGVISLIASVISFLSLFLLLGMDNAVFVSFYQYKKEKKIIISSAFWFLFFWGLLLTLVAGIFSNQVSLMVFKASSYRLILLITFLTAYLTLLINLAKMVFRLEFRAKTFALVSIFNALIATGLMILFVVYFRQGLMGYFIGSLIGTFLTVLMALYLIRSDLRFAFSYKRLKEMVLFGVMFVPASLSFFVFDLSDRFFINHYRNLTELGLYSIGINIASLIVFFSFAFGQAWSPQVMKMYFSSKKVFHQFVPRFFIYYLIFFFSLALFLSVFSQEILMLMTTAQFYPAMYVVPALSLAMVFAATNQITSLGINIARKTKYFAFYTGLAAVINIVFNFLLIPKFGMIGAAWATAISYFFLTVAYFVISQKFIPLKLDWQKIVKLILLSLAFILLGPRLWLFGFWGNLAVKFLEFGSFCALLYLLGIIERQEVAYLKTYLKKFFKLVSRRRK